MPSVSIPAVAIGAVGGMVLSSVLSGGAKTPSIPNAPAPPALAPVTPMPSIDDQAAQDARTRQIQSDQAQSGRLSTILSSNTSGSSDKLGG